MHTDEETDWWIELMTARPSCTYYFGPFASFSEASDHMAGYVEDLVLEGARCISLEIKRCHPTQLTIVDPFNSLDAIAAYMVPLDYQ